ncbi:uroporphyrinogen-III synthase [Vibrio ishigakensis]|uniref:Uroporphyrinogen-III synthase n=1 Tax=Vibrio ishigakensis TaxID=1481914 RepID=A0A0B8PH75_9VIBR|nr:uroporphyrinogen-III synthase [Vibrio ishigakensis]
MKVLIVRPEPDASELQSALSAEGIASLCYPAVSFIPSTISKQAIQYLISSDFIITVSKPATQFTQQILDSHNQAWPEASYLAVGKGSAELLSQCSKYKVLHPNIETSEGLLELLASETLQQKQISILRGDSGREFLKEQLEKRGAMVNYFESYRREWHPLASEEQITKWRSFEIDTAIVTSFEQLKFFAQQVPSADKNWLHSLQLLVPSQRVAKLATDIGFQKVRSLEGAANQQILEALQSEIDRNQ